MLFRSADIEEDAGEGEDEPEEGTSVLQLSLFFYLLVAQKDLSFPLRFGFGRLTVH